MSNTYLPIPARVWSRVQNSCTYTIPNNTYSSIFIPLTNKTVSLAEADYEKKLLYKGNILQYKANSSRLTKNQKYTQISKGLWCNRTKVFATQTQTYTNPDTTSLLRVNYTELPFPNQIVGQPNNISGPFQYNVPNPFDCSSNMIQVGGNLVCGTYVNPCSNQIIQFQPQGPQCYSTSCSDVPGKPQLLCWNSKLQSWFPRSQYTMNNSNNKWPQGYKGFVSAVTPLSPNLLSATVNLNSVTLLWSINNNNNCIPISSFNIYQNNILIQNVPYTTTSITIYNLISKTNYTFYIKSISTTILSASSNSLTISI